MAERGVDKTSLIKLGLYMFTSFMSRSDVRHMPLDGVVALIESRAPKSFPSTRFPWKSALPCIGAGASIRFHLANSGE